MEPLVPVTVTTYAPVVVPVVPVGVPPLVLLDPQPMTTPARAPKSSTPRIELQLRRRAGIPKKRSPARASPPPTAKSLFSCEPGFTAAVAELVVVMVRVDGVDTVAVVGERLHPGMFTAPLGILVTAQVNETFPVKPVVEFTEIVEVVLPPGLLTAAALVLASVKVAATGELTVIVT